MRRATASRGGTLHLAGIVQDITERKHAGEALRDLGLSRSLALEAAQAGTWAWELATGRSMWSDELWRLFGLSRQAHDPSYALWLEMVHPEDRAGVEAALAGIVSCGSALHLEWRVNAPDGSLRWLMSRGRPLRDGSGKVTRYLGVVIDVTAIKAHTEALKARNEELERFNQASVERELDMIKLKERVNELAARLGEEPPYDLTFACGGGEA